MKTFHYAAKAGPMQRIEGTMQGDSTSGVARSLMARGLFPVEVTELGVDGIMPCGDLGSSTGLMASPDIFRRMVYPHNKAHAEAARKHGLKAQFLVTPTSLQASFARSVSSGCAILP